MTAVGRRRLRVLFKIGLLVCLPLTGYFWAQTGVSAAAIAMSVICVVMALGAEGFASAAETELSQIKARSASEERSFETEVQTKDEKIRQMDRIVETLSNQNHDLRGKLVSIHGEIHRMGTEAPRREAKAEAPRREAPAAQPEQSAQQEAAQQEPQGGTGADITDISTLRSRR